MSLEVLVNGKFPAVEEELRSVFKTAIGADSLSESNDIKEGVTYNEHKGVVFSKPQSNFPTRQWSKHGNLVNGCDLLGKDI